MKQKLYIILVISILVLFFNFKVNATSTIPSDYVLLDYIESDSRDQVINTEYMFNLDTVIECVCNISSNQIDDGYAFGTQGYVTGDGEGNALSFAPYYYLYGDNKSVFNYYSTGLSKYCPVHVSSSEFPFDEKITINVNVEERTLSYSGSKSKKLFATTPFSTSVAPIFIFNTSMLENDSSNYFPYYNLGCKMKLYRFTIKENDTVIKNFIPVYSKSEHINGLYDIVNNKFYKDLDGKDFLSNHEIEKVDGIAATETSDGYKDAYFCSVCHEYFSDVECHNIISDGSGDEAHNNSLYEEWKTSGSGFIEKHKHLYKDSVCSVCGYNCPHDSFNGSICNSCGFDKSIILNIKYANLAFETNTYILIAVEAKNNHEDPLLYVWTEGDNSYLPTDSDLTILEPDAKNYTLIDGNPYYIYIYNKLGMKQMCDYIYCKAYCEGTYSELFKYSVLAYITNKVLSFPEESERTEKQNEYLALFQKMCDYGCQAQEFFNYKTDKLPSLNYVPVKYKNMLYPDGSTIDYVVNGEDIYFDMPDGCNVVNITGGESNPDYTYEEYNRHITITCPTTIEAKCQETDCYYITIKPNDYSLGNVYIGNNEVTYIIPYNDGDYKIEFDTYGDIYHMFLDVGSYCTLEAKPNDNAVFIGWNVTEGTSIYNNMVIEAIFYPKVEAYVSINLDVVTIYAGEKRNEVDECLNIWTDNRFRITEVLNNVKVYIDPSMYDIKGFQYYRLMFNNYFLYSIDEIWGLEYLDMSYTTNLNYMFNNINIKSIDLSKWDVSKVEDMSYMFYNCDNLTTIDLTGWNLKNIIFMSQTFCELDNLETIYCDFDFSKVAFYSTPNDVFVDTPKLTGGNGTKYSSENSSYTYGRIDAKDTPGYFTEK